jgi:hypothetical protein
VGYRGQPSFQACCQWAHVATAMAIAFGCVVCGLSAWWGLLAVVVWIGLKEWVWDFWWPVGWPWSWCGENDTFAGSLLDSTFYAAGMCVSAVVFALTNRY